MISNTYWGRFEDYRQPLTPVITEAVARAFEWDESWPFDETEISPTGGRTLAGLLDAVGELQRQMAEVRTSEEAAARRIAELGETTESLRRRIEQRGGQSGGRS